MWFFFWWWGLTPLLLLPGVLGCRVYNQTMESTLFFFINIRIKNRPVFFFAIETKSNLPWSSMFRKYKKKGSYWRKSVTERANFHQFNMCIAQIKRFISSCNEYLSRKIRFKTFLCLDIQLFTKVENCFWPTWYMKVKKKQQKRLITLFLALHFEAMVFNEGEWKPSGVFIFKRENSFLIC